MVVFRNFCYFTIVFTIATSIIRVLFHFLMREFWIDSGKDISYAEFMYRVTQSFVWKYRMKKPSFYETMGYSIRVILINLIYILIALGLLFIVIFVDRSKYGVWLDILI